MSERVTPDLSAGLREAITDALLTAPATGTTRTLGEEKWDHHPRPGAERGHRYFYGCALCVSDVEALAAAALAVVEPQLAELRERAAAIAPYEHATYGDRSVGYRAGWDACRAAFRAALLIPDDTPTSPTEQPS
ncbi:hypothetical protein [Streptomyces sp. URMC 129]|uniref:hypothetical protein n=1 Tax=Streptomyces sp. URMC 129 TaxID=3423407 RepID=UPI003F1D7145